MCISMNMDLKYGTSTVRIACIVFTLVTLQLQFATHAVDVVIGMTDTCENEFCTTFQEILHNTSNYFTSDSNIRFSPGNYTVEQQVQVIAKDIHSLSLISTSSSHNQLQSATFINCNENLSFVFLNVTNLQILGLNFVKCGLQVPVHIIPSVVLAYYGRLSPLYAAVFLAYAKNLTVANVSIVYSQGYGILALNVHGNSTIENSQLLGDAQQATSVLHVPIQQNLDIVHCLFGNAWFIFDDSSEYPVEVQQLHISGVQISWTTSDYECSNTTVSDNVQTGLGFKFLQKCYPMELDMDHILFISGMHGLNIEIHATANSTRFFIRDSKISTQVSYVFGSSILLSDKLNDQYLSTYHEFKFTNCQIVKRSLPLLQLWNGITIKIIDSNLQFKSAQVQIFIENCTFSSSALVLSTPTTCESRLNGSLLITQSNFISVTSMVPSIELNFGNYTNPCFFLVSVKLCQFIENHKALSAGSTSVTTLEISDTTIQKGGGVILTSMTNVILENTKFQNCKDESITALTLLGTTVYFKGDVTFSNNRGRYGGAIALESWRVFHTEMVKESFLYFYPHTHLYLLNNTALNLGGGIYVKEFLLDTRYRCFYQVAEWNGMELDQLDIKIVFDGNSADVAGDSIFGGLDTGCLLGNYNAGELNVFDILFEIQKNSMSSSELATPVQQICVCNLTAMTPACETYREYVYVAYPGQMFEFPAVALGSLTNFYFQKGALPEAVYSSFNSSFSAQLGPQQEVQRLPNSCGNLTFTVFSAQKVVYLNSFIKTSDNKEVNKDLDYISFSIHLLACPLGFQLGGDPPRCECIKLLTDNNCKCTVSRTLTYYCPEGFWLGKTTDSTLIHRHCPFRYCASVGPVSTTCADNRTGILCGGCKPGYSLALGTSRCLPNCSHTYILLIIPIALAGVLLVAFLLICNLTVSTGTINGLIYFTNIVGFNNELFFPKSENSFFLVFISWLNLDLGIETCFYPGMDMYTKTWLQFLFPFYIWAIVFVIIISSHYSVLVTKLTRSNAVPVLATLLRLSYAKVLYTVITALSFTFLKSSDGAKNTVWLYDGNVAFLSGRHIALFLFAILTLLLLVFPYTILLLLSPFLQANASHRRLRLVNKMKPFLDAYHGPYRDRFRNWTGVMLLVQMLQFLAFACNSLGDPNINLLVIVITSAGLLTLSWNFGSIYNKKLLTTLESFFILLLTVLAVASLYIGAVSDPFTQDRNQKIATSIIVGTLFTVFIMILTYHAISLTQSLSSNLKNARGNNDYGNDIELDINVLQSNYIQPQRPPSCSSVELREPLLDL